MHSPILDVRKSQHTNSFAISIYTAKILTQPQGKTASKFLLPIWEKEQKACFSTESFRRCCIPFRIIAIKQNMNA